MKTKRVFNQVTYSVNEEWLKDLQIPATEDTDNAVFTAALGNPYKSGIQVTEVENDEEEGCAKAQWNEIITQQTSLVGKARQINMANRGHEIMVTLHDFADLSAPTYKIKVDGLLHEVCDYTAAEHALDDLKKTIPHLQANEVKVYLEEVDMSSPSKERLSLEYLLNTKFADRDVQVLRSDDHYVFIAK